MNDSMPTSSSCRATYSMALRSPGPLVVTRVGGVDPDQLRAEVDHLGGGVVGGVVAGRRVVEVMGNILHPVPADSEVGHLLCYAIGRTDARRP